MKTDRNSLFCSLKVVQDGFRLRDLPVRPVIASNEVRSPGFIMPCRRKQCRARVNAIPLHGAALYARVGRGGIPADRKAGCTRRRTWVFASVGHSVQADGDDSTRQCVFRQSTEPGLHPGWIVGMRCNHGGHKQGCVPRQGDTVNLGATIPHEPLRSDTVRSKSNAQRARRPF